MEGPKVGWNTAPAIPYGSAPGSAWSSNSGYAHAPAPPRPPQQPGQMQLPHEGPFSDPNLTLQEIADKANALQQQIDENAGRQKAELRAAMEAKHREVDQHSQAVLRHTVQSIEARKASQLQLIERQRAQEEAAIRSKGAEAKQRVDLEAQRALAALETSHGGQWMNRSPCIAYR
ncbi:unnamed protein product [Symbiodinium pilosum]|uniref:Uncharacterized protein n=1 Tax=Symbiodinium pilosum TaxID=2952 RepID=A0A812KFL3_SYMPI|nr:unnamed protein product [Symbiodinium pilosum]